MPGKTTYLGLNTALHDDVVNHETHLNENWIKIDEKIKEANVQLADISINVKKFGAVGDGVADDTQAFIDVFNYMKSLSKRTKLYIPKGVYNVNTDSLTEGFNIENVIIEGEFTGILQNYVQDKKVGTYIVDKSVTSSFPLFQFGSTATRTMGGLKISNIQIVGNRRARDAIRLERIGWEIVFENVYVDNFGGAGILFNSNYDGNFTNITITRCGGATVNSSFRRSLEFIATDGNNNAIKFNNLHIEDTYFMIGATSLRHCYFVNSKFEVGLWSGAAKESMTGVDLTQAPIKIRDSQEISFLNTFFVPLNVNGYEDNGITLANIPYFIDYDIPNGGTLSAESSLKFTNCDFSTSITGSGAKFIKNTSNTTVVIINCQFDYVSGRVYSIDLYGAYSKITDSKIVINNNTYGEVMGIQVTDGLIRDCTIASVGTAVIVDTAGVYTVYVKGLGRCENVDVKIGKYKIGTNSTQTTIKRIPRRKTVDDTLISSYTTLDYNNIVLDLSVIDSSLIKLSLGANATIKEIKNGGIGEEVTIFINNANTYTFFYDSLKGANATKVKTGTSLVGESVVKLVKFDHLWRDIGISVL